VQWYSSANIGSTSSSRSAGAADPLVMIAGFRCGKAIRAQQESAGGNCGTKGFTLHVIVCMQSAGAGSSALLYYRRSTITVPTYSSVNWWYQRHQQLCVVAGESEDADVFCVCTATMWQTDVVSAKVKYIIKSSCWRFWHLSLLIRDTGIGMAVMHVWYIIILC